MTEEKNLDKAVEKEVSELKTSLGDKLSEVQIAELIKNNLFVLEFEGNTYKLEKPDTSQLGEMYSLLAKKKKEFLLDDDVLPAEILKQKWKSKGIDIKALENKIKKLEEEKEKIKYTLGKILEEDNDMDNPESFRKKIEEINKEQRELSDTILQYLDISLENQLAVFQYKCLAYLITKKVVKENDKEKIVKAFETYEDYLKMPTNFTNRLNVYALLLVRDEIDTI